RNANASSRHCYQPANDIALFALLVITFPSSTKAYNVCSALEYVQYSLGCINKRPVGRLLPKEWR
ncbi:MAG: hypothetical protein M3247_09095, partial [Thermoproteota archaeon]|nr:hypothetical protein [Thermoproteota archaeon]